MKFKEIIYIILTLLVGAALIVFIGVPLYTIFYPILIIGAIIWFLIYI